MGARWMHSRFLAMRHVAAAGERKSVAKGLASHDK